VEKDGNILAIGFNGTPSGENNTCEDRVYYSGVPVDDHWGGQYIPDPTDYPFEDEKGKYYLTTKDNVIHAEENCLMKMARSNSSCVGATMYVTMSPCVPCSRMMFSAGFVRIVYGEEYRDRRGLDFLERRGVKCDFLE
jgi:deoxycytidylate deaminase